MRKHCSRDVEPLDRLLGALLQLSKTTLRKRRQVSEGANANLNYRRVMLATVVDKATPQACARDVCCANHARKHEAMQ
jgi:hypothetical protein